MFETKDYIISDGKENSAGQLLKGINETRTFSLKEGIEQIQQQIVERQKLHKELLIQIDQMLMSINNMMPPINQNNPEYSKAVTELRKKIIESEEMKIQEKLNCSRDVAELKKELRELMREFLDKEKRASFLGDILNE